MQMNHHSVRDGVQGSPAAGELSRAAIPNEAPRRGTAALAQAVAALESVMNGGAAEELRTIAISLDHLTQLIELRAQAAEWRAQGRLPEALLAERISARLFAELSREPTV